MASELRALLSHDTTCAGQTATAGVSLEREHVRGGGGGGEAMVLSVSTEPMMNLAKWQVGSNRDGPFPRHGFGRTFRHVSQVSAFKKVLKIPVLRFTKYQQN